MPRAEKPWMIPLAKTMAEEGCTFRMGLAELGVPVSADEADRVERSAEFKELYRAAREREWEKIATNPARSKTSTIGAMVQCAQQLMKEGLWEKAIIGWKTISQLEGWMGAEVTSTVLLGLSQREIDEARVKLAPLQKKNPKELLQ